MSDVIPFSNRTSAENTYFSQREEVIKNNPRYQAGEYVDHPFVYCSRQALTGSLFRIKLYERILNVHGSVIECGVHRGNNFMLFNQLAAIYEPYNLTRSIIGFDTFEGFRSLDEGLDAGATTEHFSDSSHRDIQTALDLLDRNRPIPNVGRGELVKGDAVETIPAYVAQNPHLVVALLYLDFDIYEPTKVALKHFLPLMPRGAIIAFDELAVRHWPGEARAVKEMFELNNLRIERMPFEAYASFAIIGS